MWSKWSEKTPEVGDKFVMASNDGCSTLMGVALDGSGKGDVAFFDAECGDEISSSFKADVIWCRLPDDYPIRFMNLDD